MDRTNYKTVQEKDWVIVEKYLMEYTEADVQRHHINEKNAELNLKGKYLVVPMQVFSRLSGNEAIIYSFLNSWESTNGKERFYFSNSHLSQRFNISESTVSNIIQSLRKKWLVDVRRKRKAWGGEIRFINVKSTCESRHPKIVSRGCQKLTGSIKSKSNKNNIHQTQFDDLIRFWLGEEYITTQFGYKKSLDRLLELCLVIEQVSELLDIEPVYDRDTVNATDQLLKTCSKKELITYVIGNSVDEWCSDYKELIRNDYYLPDQVKDA